MTALCPTRAIDVIDEAGAYQRLLPASRRKKKIGISDIEAVVAKIANIPPKHVSTSDKAALADLEGNLKRVVFGQDRAIEALAAAIKLSRAGLNSPEKPIGSFLFAGPTGVGKTEVSRQLANIMGMELVRFGYVRVHGAAYRVATYWRAHRVMLAMTKVDC